MKSIQSLYNSNIKNPKLQNLLYEKDNRKNDIIDNLSKTEKYKLSTAVGTSNLVKQNNNFPEDKIDISDNSSISISKKALDGRQVNFTYSPTDKKISATLSTSESNVIDIKNENLPREFKDIKSPQNFNAYLKNTFVKISTLSDGADKISLYQKLLGGGNEEEELAAKMLDFMESAKKSSEGVRKKAVDIVTKKLEDSGELNVSPSVVKESLLSMIGSFALGVFKSIGAFMVDCVETVCGWIGSGISYVYNSCTIF